MDLGMEEHSPGFSSNVTAPVRASALSIQRRAGGKRDGACAIMIPWNIVLVPSVAELPTCQNTFWADWRRRPG